MTITLPAARSLTAPGPCLVHPPAAESTWFYGEADLQRTQTTVAEGVPALMKTLLEAATPLEREQRVWHALRALGFEWMGCANLRQHRGEWRPHSVMTTYAPPAWVQQYRSSHPQEVDSRLQQLLRSCLPLTWDLATLSDSSPRLVQELADGGVHSGVSLRLSVNGAHAADELAVVSLMSSREGRGWIDDERLGQALTFLLCWHEFLSRHVQPLRQEATPHHDLSAMQRRILGCLQQGQSDKEIAYRLELSSHAVDYHMRQLRRRFSARNRVQLVNAAMQAS
jgi:DNA-binding CsgD family transcriptional regulator